MEHEELRLAMEELLNAWNKVMDAVNRHYPSATDEEKYEIAKSAMDKALGLPA